MCGHPLPDEWYSTAVWRQAIGRCHIARVEPIAGSKLGLSVSVVRNLQQSSEFFDEILDMVQ
jgi:hypothetical protein